MDAARDILDLTMATLRGNGVVRRYRVGKDPDGVRGVATLAGRKGQAGELRVQVVGDGDNATVVIWWRNPMMGNGRWWSEVAMVMGGNIDPYAADLSAVTAILADVRRYALGSLGVKALNSMYTRVPIRAAAESMWTRGMTWA